MSSFKQNPVMGYVADSSNTQQSDKLATSVVSQPVVPANPVKPTTSFREEFGDMIQMTGDVLVITTNGFVTNHGKCVMGRGIAKQIADRYPNVPYVLGKAIKANGNVVNLLNVGQSFLSFPVKPISDWFDGSNVVAHAASKYTVGQQVPGFLCKARLDIIERSLAQLVSIADSYQFRRVLCPRFGCGAGELDWYKDVRPLCEKYLDDRFVICNFKDDRPIVKANYDDSIVVSRIGYSPKGYTPVYIGSNKAGQPYNPLCNPIRLESEAHRDECIHQFAQQFKAKVMNKSSQEYQALLGLYKRIKSGERISLECSCAPKKCHGDVIKFMLLKALAPKPGLNG